MSSAKLNATTIRWVGDLANYHFNVKYRPGKVSTDCDYLSRNPVDFSKVMEQSHEEISSETIGAVVAGSKLKGKFATVNSLASVMVSDPDRLTIPKVCPVEIKEGQRNDATVGAVLKWVESGTFPPKEMCEIETKIFRLHHYKL